MASVVCRATGITESPNMYDGMEVVVIYYSSSLGWVIEEGFVENGVVELSGEGPGTNERYYIGLKYTSRMRTFPIRGDGKLNSKGRLSKVSLFFSDNLAEGSVTVGGESANTITQEIELPEGFTQGKYEVNVGTSFEEEPYVEIEATGLHDFNLLALGVDYKQSER